MPQREILPILLPKAIDMGDSLVGSRAYDLQLFAYVKNYYTSIDLTGIRIIPNFAPVQAWVFRNDVELGRYASQNGILDVAVHADADTPIVLRLFNLSIDTEVTLTLEIEGNLYNAV